MRRGDTLKLEGPLYLSWEPERKGIALICTDTGYPAVVSLLAQIINIEFEGYVMPALPTEMSPHTRTTTAAPCATHWMIFIIAVYTVPPGQAPS